MLKLSPPGLVAGAGYGAYTLTSAILENGLEATAISIAKGIVDLPYELKARLNSNDPTVRGEALVDVIALGSSTAYLTHKLGMAVVNTADQAVAKAVAKAAAQRADDEAIAAAKINNNLYRDGSSQTVTSGLNETTPIKDKFGKVPNNSDLEQHLSVGGPSIKNIYGAHSESAFKEELSSINGSLIGEPVSIAPGIKVYEYNTPSRITKGDPPLTKTTYDTTYTDEQILDMSKRASSQVWTEIQRTGITPGQPVNTTIDGVPFRVLIERDSITKKAKLIYSHPGFE